MSKYVVIGGQYKAYNYGTANTLRAAKMLASKNEEYWDNWQEWHKPRIYSAEDVRGDLESIGFDKVYFTDYAYPAAIWEDGKWYHWDEEAKNYGA